MEEKERVAMIMRGSNLNTANVKRGRNTCPGQWRVGSIFINSLINVFIIFFSAFDGLFLKYTFNKSKSTQYLLCDCWGELEFLLISYIILYTFINSIKNKDLTFSIKC